MDSLTVKRMLRYTGRVRQTGSGELEYEIVALIVPLSGDLYEFMHDAAHGVERGCQSLDWTATPPTPTGDH